MTNTAIHLSDDPAQSRQLTRRLGAFEHLIWSLDQWAPKHFVLVARIEGGLISEDRLADAFREVQRRHPALRVAIESAPDGGPRFVPVATAVPVCIVERVTDTQWQSEVETQLASPFHAEAGPLLRATLVRGKPVSELILAVHHSIGDGLSAMFLVSDLLELLEGRRLEELPARSSMEELAGCDATRPVVFAPTPHEHIHIGRPGTPKVTTLEICRQELERILSLCRQHRTTLTAALLAAILRSLPGGSVCLAPVNIRSLCPPIQDDFGLYISAGTASFDQASKNDFWTVARAAREQIASALTHDSFRRRTEAIRSMVNSNPGPRSESLPFRHGVNYEAVLSNLRQFPLRPTVRQYRVTAVYPVLNVELEPVVALATANGRMTINITSASPTDAERMRLAFDLLPLEAV